jgi:glyoxylase-like metal-dependent hydrolase (beta-lactamase superfamily II)
VTARTVALAAALLTALPGPLNAEADKYDIYAVRFATVAGRPAVFWVLKGADGRVALVDSGFGTNRARRAGVRDYVSPAAAIGPLGLRPPDVTDIFLTRLDADRAGGLDLFPQARVWVQRREFDYAVGDAWAEPSLHRDIAAADVLALVRRNIAGLLTLVRGDDDVSISGIELHVGRDRRPGGSQYLVVQSRTGRFVLAADRADVAAEMPAVVVEDDPAAFTAFERVADRIVRVGP